MIEIFEDKSKKLCGNYSLFIKFDFNRDVIDVLKQCNSCVFDKKTCYWEMPETSLAFLLDNLCLIDDIKLTLKNVKNEETHNDIDMTFKTTPLGYQYDGIRYGLNHDKWLLLDDAGLGKTLQTLYIAEELHHQGKIEHCLIICGINTLKSNWAREIQKHSNLSYVILGEKVSKSGKVSYATISERAEQLENKIDEFFIITNVETVRDDRIVKAFKKSKNNIDMIIFDELHKAKNPSSQQGHNLLKMTAKYMIGCTGTLLMNNPLDAYLPLKWIGQENASFTNFKYFYCNFSKTGFGYEITGYKNLDVLKNQISRCSLRRTKKEVLTFLPPKTIIEEYVDMDDANRRFYDDIKAGVKEEADKIELTTNSVLALSTRLRQATSCPTILTSQSIVSTKLVRASQLIDEITAQGDKVVVFSTFKQPLYELENMCKKHKPLVITGDTKSTDVDKSIVMFQNDGEHQVILCTTQKLGTGVTLTKANYAIFIDTPYTYAEFSQACDRIYRVGTTKNVFIYNLICNDTIDERVKQLVDTKEAIADFVVDDKLTPKGAESLRQYIEDL